MKNTRYLLFVMILTLSLLLSSCSDILPSSNDTGHTDTVTDSVNSGTTVKPSVPKDETIYIHSGNPDYPVYANAYLKALPDRDFGGSTFFISSPSTGLYDPNEIHYLSDTVGKRNRLVEEKYNIKIEIEKVTADTMYEEASKAKLAGMYYTNIMCLPFSEVGSFASAGLLTNLRSLPLLDLTQPYFNQSSVKALSAGYMTYGVAGEATPVTDLPCIVYNTAIAKNIGLTDLYDVALKGDLTWDQLYQYMEACLTTETYTAAALEGIENFDHIFKSLGEAYVISSPATVPSVGVAAYSMNYSATYARYMMRRGAELGITKETAVDAFNEGKVLFTVGKIGDLDRYRNSSVQIGILPMPKFEKNWPYISSVSGNALVMTIPVGNTNSEMSSLVLSAMNAASYGYISEAVVDYLHATALPDNRSADVLDLMTRTAVYDFSTGFEEEVPSLTELKKLVRQLIDTGDFTEFDKITGEANSELKKNFPLGY